MEKMVYCFYSVLEIMDEENKKEIEERSEGRREERNKWRRKGKDA